MTSKGPPAQFLPERSLPGNPSYTLGALLPNAFGAVGCLCFERGGRDESEREYHVTEAGLDPGVSLIGLVQFIRAPGVNIGAFLIPAALAGVILFVSRPVKGSPDGRVDERAIRAQENRKGDVLLISEYENHKAK